MFKLLPKHSWISLAVKPDNYTLNNFSGGIYSEFNAISINQGLFESYDSIILKIDDKKYELEPYEFKVEFNIYKDADMFGSLPYANFSIFTPYQANIYPTLDSEPPISNSKIAVKKILIYIKILWEEVLKI